MTSRDRIEHGLVPALQVKGRPLETFSIGDRLRRYSVPGAAVAVVRDGEVEWSAEYGVITSGGARVDATTLFQAASISKAVGALGVMVLVEHGVLDLDADVNSLLRSWHLPESPFTAQQPVTLRALLSHTAGTTVPGFPGYEVGAPVPTVPELLSGRGVANTPAVESFAAPGTVGQYSGGGTTIVQQVVCDVTGRDFAELMRKLVLSPLGMTDSDFDQPIAPHRRARAATGHRPDGQAIASGHHVYPELQAAGLWTTAVDLARWVIGVQAAIRGDAGAVISATTARMMITEVAPGPFGLGPEMAGTGAGRHFGHGGSNAGFRSQLDGLIDGRSGMVMMTNGDGGTTLCGEFRRAVALEHAWGHTDITEIDIADVDASVLRQYVGRYRGPFDLPMRLDLVDGELFSPAPYGRRRMFPLGPTTFLDEESGATLEFETTDGSVRRVAVLVGGNELMAFEPVHEEGR